MADEATPKLKTRWTDSLLNVFVPTTPNLTSAFYLLVPATDVMPLMEAGALKLITSSGLITRDDKNKYNGK